MKMMNKESRQNSNQGRPETPTAVRLPLLPVLELSEHREFRKHDIFKLVRWRSNPEHPNLYGRLLPEPMNYQQSPPVLDSV